MPHLTVIADHAGRAPPARQSRHPRHPRHPRQRGAAALIVTMVMFFAMLLVAAFANRGLVAEQRASANQYRSTQAFEAAEAGLEWALAQLNNPQPLGDDCKPSSTAGALPLRERLLRYSAAHGGHEPLTWLDAGTARALQPACVRVGAGWTCACPSSGFPTLAVPPAAPGAAQPAFTLQLALGSRPGVLQLSATGCTSLAGACQPGVAAATPADASARVQVALALVPGLVTVPTAPLTVKDAVAAGSAALGLHNPDPGSGGLLLNAGGDVDAPAARLTTAPGASTATALAANDERLHARSADALFAAFFGIDKAAWRGQAGVQRVVCGGGDCAGPLNAALAAGSADTQRLLWIDGDLPLAGPVGGVPAAPLAVGSAQHPVLIVASGHVTLRGAVALHGLVYGASLAWLDAPAGSGASMRGALVSEAGYSGNGAPDLFYDAAVLERLRSDSGSFTRVPGSWRDF